MKKVWILFAVEARGGTAEEWPWGIYTTRKKAKKAMKEMEKDYYNAYILAWELDKGKPCEEPCSLEHGSRGPTSELFRFLDKGLLIVKKEE